MGRFGAVWGGVWRLARFGFDWGVRPAHPRAGAAACVGASMGGMIAQVLALEHPQRVRSLCCIMSTTGPGSPPGWGERAGGGCG